MRPLQICDSDCRGGAARAAWRLHRGLAALGHDAAMLVREKQSADPSVFTVRLEETAASKKQRRRLKWIEKHWLRNHRTAISNTWFSLPAIGYDLSQNPQVLASQVLNLHWVSGFLSPPAIARLQQAGRPVFWTLHDQCAFTGGCHFSAGCRGSETSCAHCPQLAGDPLELAQAGLQESLRWINPKKIVVVCPSRWLAGAARSSALFAGADIQVVPNGIDTGVFRPQSKAAARRELGLDPEGIYFLFGTDNYQEKRKGFRELSGIFRSLKAQAPFCQAVSSRKIQVLCFGEPGRSLEDFCLPLNRLGRVEDDARLARIYSAADAFLLPSLEENLPNTMLEAMACGTPVIGFDIGGLPDAITPQETGLLAPAADSARFAELLRGFAGDEPGRQRMSRNCARLIPARFSVEIQARRYLQLYERALEARPPAAAGKSNGGACAPTPPSPAFGGTCDALLPLAKRERRAARWKSLKRFFSGGVPAEKNRFE
jgi:glycosyltransferase involved in cell wall biosynthesis